MYISKSIGKPKILRNSASLSAMYLSYLPLVEDIRRSADTRLSSPQCWPFVSARTQMDQVFHPLVSDRVACRLLSYVYMVVNNVLNLPGNCSGRRRCIPGWRTASFLCQFGIWPPASVGWQVFAFFRDQFQRTIRWSFIVHNLVYMLS